MHHHVQVAGELRCEAIPEVFDQFAIELTDLPMWELGMKRESDSPAEINRGGHQRFVHWQGKVAVTKDAAFITNGFCKCLPQANANILDGVMLVDVEIAFGLNLEVEQTVLGKQLQHVVKEPDSRLNRGTTLSVQIQIQLDLRFTCATFNT